MNGEIKQEGIIIDIVGSRVDVKIVCSSGCVGCAAKSACSMGESVDKIVSVAVELPQMYEVGEQVSVSVEKAMGVKAVIYAYVFPFLLLLSALLILLECGVGEVVAGLASLGFIVLYYIGLYIFRRRIEREIIFKLHKI